MDKEEIFDLNDNDIEFVETEQAQDVTNLSLTTISYFLSRLQEKGKKGKV